MKLTSKEHGKYNIDDADMETKQSDLQREKSEKKKKTWAIFSSRKRSFVSVNNSLSFIIVWQDFFAHTIEEWPIILVNLNLSSLNLKHKLFSMIIHSGKCKANGQLVYVIAAMTWHNVSREEMRHEWNDQSKNIHRRFVCVLLLALFSLFIGEKNWWISCIMLFCTECRVGVSNESSIEFENSSKILLAFLSSFFSSVKLK